MTGDYIAAAMLLAWLALVAIGVWRDSRAWRMEADDDDDR